MARGKKTGGRQLGIPNKPKPIKEQLQALSEKYFTPKPQANMDGTPRKIELRDKDGTVSDTIVLADADGRPLVMSDAEVDMMMMDPKDRAAMHEKLLRYHTAQMQSVSADVSLAGDVTATIGQRLKDLAADNNN